jgi:hypothetical protein
MEKYAKNPPPAPGLLIRMPPRQKSLVDRLCEADHPVEVGLQPDPTPKSFKEAIDRNYVYNLFDSPSAKNACDSSAVTSLKPACITSRSQCGCEEN